MVKDINYPIPPEWFIAWSEGTPILISYGYIESHQCLTTGLDNLEVFYDKESYEARLLQFGIVESDSLTLSINEGSDLLNYDEGANG
jgi:hypothetical protein